MSKSVAVELALHYLRTIGWQEKREEIKVCLDRVETQYLLINCNVVFHQRHLVAGNRIPAHAIVGQRLVRISIANLAFSDNLQE